MSSIAITSALETRLQVLLPALPTAWENVSFDPPAGAYQIVSILLSKPENPAAFQGEYYRQRGYMQLSLCYPLNTGKAAALARAELIRGWFRRGLSVTASGVTTVVDTTPEIGIGRVEGNNFVLPVFVTFYANIGS